MKRVIKYSSIELFPVVIREVRERISFRGLDENKNPIFDENATYPVIKAQLTEKLHGTNASVCFSNPDGFWIQSRTSIITPQDDNAATAFFAEKNKDVWMGLIRSLVSEYNIDLDKNIICLYFEWCGLGIQKKTAITGLDKKIAVLFSHFKVAAMEELINDAGEDVSEHKWLETKIDGKWISDESADIYNINDFPTYEVDLDLANPTKSLEELTKLVEEVIEPASPVGKKFGFEKNTGEGTVATFALNDKLYKFKVKGLEHAVKQRVKVLEPVDDAKVQLLQEVAQKVTPGWRLEQMFDLANDVLNGGRPEMKNMGPFIKLLSEDIKKEESETIESFGVNFKEVMAPASTIAREFFRDQFNASILG